MPANHPQNAENSSTATAVLLALSNVSFLNEFFSSLGILRSKFLDLASTTSVIDSLGKVSNPTSTTSVIDSLGKVLNPTSTTLVIDSFGKVSNPTSTTSVIDSFGKVSNPTSTTSVIDSFGKVFTHLALDNALVQTLNQDNHFILDLPDISECLNGGQEDAEEFLSSVLNRLNEELILGLKVFFGPKFSEAVDELQMSNVNSPNSRYKALATNGYTSVTQIFGGTMLSIRTAGENTSKTRQPFFLLKLDIQDKNKIRKVEDALEDLSKKELIHGSTCPKTNKTIEAISQTYIEKLPTILILHLKLFNGENGQTKKSMEKIELPVDLKIPEECLTKGEGPKYTKSYKLLAVVHHDGKEVGKGHYITDIYHIGTSSWLRCDDSKVEAISVQQVTKPQHSKIPYLLFYRRCDKPRGRENKN